MTTPNCTALRPAHHRWHTAVQWQTSDQQCSPGVEHMLLGADQNSTGERQARRIDGLPPTTGGAVLARPSLRRESSSAIPVSTIMNECRDQAAAAIALAKVHARATAWPMLWPIARAKGNDRGQVANAVSSTMGGPATGLPVRAVVRTPPA